VLREAAGPVPAARFDVVWPDPAQRARALTALVADGLAAALANEMYALPGHP
jgi:A/G-specific adenine glycosylase